MADVATPRTDAAAIWEAAIDAVRPERLVAVRLAVAEGEVLLDGRPLRPPLRLDDAGRIVVVGAGKAAAGLAAGVETLLGSERLRRHAVAGLVSVPAGSGRVLARVEVRETRPAAANLPTAEVVAATRDMLALVRGLGPRDVAVAVVTGGGSALLCLPRPGVPLAEKVAVSRFLAEAGAGIHELNLVRQAASAVKGGGLARACGAGRLLVLVLSDVVGDPLDVIASGPCMPSPPCPRRALAVLDRFGVGQAGIAPTLVAAIAADAAGPPVTPAEGGAGTWTTPGGCRVTHVLLGGNDTAVAAAAARARDIGYAVTARPARPDAAHETATEVGHRLAAEGLELAAAAARDGVPRAIVAGGEATVRVPADHGRGGRNQQTVVAALAAMGSPRASRWPTGLAIASIGTDGEDGPTTAAGGLATADVQRAIVTLGLDVARAVARCDALPLLESAGGLVVTGPTGTNVADLRIVLARPPAAGPVVGAGGTRGEGGVRSSGG